MKEDPRLFAVWLQLAAGNATRTAKTVLERLKTPREVYEADQEALRALSLSPERLEKLMNKDLSEAREILEFCRKNGVFLLTVSDLEYPASLRELPDPPAVLYAVGDRSLLSGRFTAAVVGSRHPSAYGEACTKRISYDLAGAGCVIVSGLASGVDALSHRAALLRGGATVSVLGCGIDRFYPAENEALQKEIMEKGLVLTEYAPGTPPLSQHFPQRNRIIASLGDAVLVMEGSDRSGSLITAELALRMGKPLYSVPGSIFSRGCAGSNFLLKIGAKPLLSPYEVLADFREKYPELRSGAEFFEKERDRRKKEAVEKAEAQKTVKVKIKKEIGGFVFAAGEEKNEKTTRRAKKKKENPAPEIRFTEVETETESEPEDEVLFALTPEEKSLYERITASPAAPDALLKNGENSAQILRTLTKLEILGLISRLPSGKVCRRGGGET